MVNPFPKTVSMLTNPTGWKNGTIYSNNVSPLTNKNNPYTNPATPYAGNTNQMTLPKNQTDQSKVAASPTSPNAESVAKVKAEMDARQKLGVPDNQSMDDYFANQNKVTPQTNADLGNTGTTGTGTTTGNKTSAQTNVISGLASGGAPTLSDLVSLLYNNYNSTNDAVSKSQQDLKDFQTSYAQNIGKIEGQTIPLEFQQGQKQVIANQYANELPAYTTAVQNALTAKGQSVSGLQTALGAASPIQVPYSNQVINPQTGLPVSGTSSTSMNDAVNNIITKVKNGTMGYDAGVSALSAYGQAGVDALQKGLGSDFNIQQSNAQAQAQGASTLQTGTTGGQITKAATSANSALDKLQSDFEALPDLEKLGVPGTIGIEQAIGNFFGNTALSTYKTTLNDARAQLSSVLASTGSMTQTEAEQKANEYLPDNMTSGQIKAKISAAKTLVQQRVDAYTGTGGATGTETNNYSW